jgi:hypothetical protein
MTRRDIICGQERRGRRNPRLIPDPVLRRPKHFRHTHLPRRQNMRTDSAARVTCVEDAQKKPRDPLSRGSDATAVAGFHEVYWRDGYRWQLPRRRCWVTRAAHARGSGWSPQRRRAGGASATKTDNKDNSDIRRRSARRSMHMRDFLSKVFD